MKINVIIFNFVLLVFSTGCATVDLSSQKFLDEYLTRDFPASREKCFNATTAALKEMKISVAKRDPSTGSIVTERATYSIHATGDAYTAVATNSQQKYTLKISGDKKSCRVAATKYQIYANGKEWKKGMNPSWGKENLWDPLFDTIHEKLVSSH